MMDASFPAVAMQRRLPYALLLVIAVVCFAISLITPPFQAPDEAAHIQRAYMLAKGQILLHSHNGSPSGGMVDKGLLDYMNAFAPIVGHADRKVSVEDLQTAKAIHWSGQGAFVNPTGTAYYFPGLYLPQAVALRLAMSMNLTIHQSYMLARLFSLVSCILVLIVAFRIYPPPLAVLGVLALPMNLFLFSAAVLDPMATATTVLVLACFMRCVVDEQETPPAVLLLLVATVVLTTSCRANLLPLLSLPFVISWRTRDRRLFIYSLLGTLFVLAWTMYTVRYTVYPNDPRNIDHAKRLFFYIFHPWKFISILYATLTDSGRTTFYAQSFIGILGALDTPLPSKTYKVLGMLLGLIFLLSLPAKAATSKSPYRLLLVACALCAVLLAFLALLVQWTIEPATTIDGIQGRYFTIPLLVFAYALPACPRLTSPLIERSQALLTAGLLVIGTYYSVQLLVGRYYIGTRQTAPPEAVVRPSAPLLVGHPLLLHFPADQTTNPEQLSRIDLRFGTYLTKHIGGASLHLWTAGGDSITVPFELSSLVDNAYRRFDLDGKRYVGGDIVSDGGQGVSVYESASMRTGITTCLAAFTVGAPSPRQVPRLCPAP